MGGKDERPLNHFAEPDWDFQVIRFLGGDGRDVIPRKDKIWSLSEVAARMVETLSALGRPVPSYLQTLALKP